MNDGRAKGWIIGSQSILATVPCAAGLVETKLKIKKKLKRKGDITV